MRPERAAERLQRSRVRWKCTHERHSARGYGLEARATVDHDCAACVSPDREVSALVSTVVEAALAKLLDEPGGLRGPCKVDRAVTRENPIEESEMIRNAARERLAGGGAQPDAPLCCPLAPEPLEKLFVVGKGGRLQ